MIDLLRSDPNCVLRKTQYQGNPHLGIPAAGYLASGASENDILAEYPQLAHEDALATIAYEAEAACERIIPVPTEYFA